jgi:mRNA-degrading endonuclease YafQ of YafQ-DinJ toxin-antitoxin module
MNKYSIVSTSDFEKSFMKLTARNAQLAQRIRKTVHQLSENPFHIGLKTHKVLSRNFGEKYSSRVTGDLRIIWKFEHNKLIIAMLDLGGHDAGGVYK